MPSDQLGRSRTKQDSHQIGSAKGGRVRNHGSIVFRGCSARKTPQRVWVDGSAHGTNNHGAYAVVFENDHDGRRTPVTRLITRGSMGAMHMEMRAVIRGIVLAPRDWTVMTDSRVVAVIAACYRAGGEAECCSQESYCRLKRRLRKALQVRPDVTVSFAEKAIRGDEHILAHRLAQDRMRAHITH